MRLKNYYPKIQLIFLFIGFIYGCSSTKRVPDDEYLLTKSTITVNGDKENSDDIAAQTFQKPNGKLLGIPVRLLIYNMAKPTPQASYESWLKRKSGREETLNKILSAKQVDRLGNSFLVSGMSRVLKSIGQPPVILDEVKAQKSKARLRNYYFNRGFFDTKVSTNIDTVSFPKKAQVSFNVETGLPYFIDSLDAKIQSPALKSLYEVAKPYTLMKKGDQYYAATLDKERERITQFFRNNGAYDFQKTYINYEIDTLNQNHTAHLYTLIDDKNVKSGDTLIKVPFKLYKIKTVNIYTTNAQAEDKTLDTITYKGIKINSVGKLNYRPKVLANATFISEGDWYSDEDKALTTRSFANLNVFNYPTIEYIIDSNDSLQNSLIANIRLLPRKRASFNPTIDITHNNIQQVGIQATVSTSFRNVFKGAEILDVGIRGNIGSSASRYRNDQNNFFDILEYGADVKLKFPRFLFFTNTDFLIPRRMFPQTTVSLGFTTQKNIGLDKQNATTIFNYFWNPRTRNTFSWDVYNLQFVRNMNPNNYFNVYKSSYNTLNRIANENNVSSSFIDENGNLTIAEGGADAFINAVLNNQTSINNQSGDYNSVRSIAERKNRLTENNFIFASSLTFSRTTRFNLADNTFYSIRAKVESAGNVMSLLSKTNLFEERIDGKKTIYGVAYSQYIKTELDFIKYYEIKPGNVLAFRAFGGIAIPYGNSDNIPFSRSYFAGGSNDNRAWQSYRLGPGRSGGVNDFNEANLKLAMSAEYRLHLSGRWNTAFFIDAGNIWNVLDNTTDEKMIFNSFKSLKDIAVGSGMGIRYDFKFFVIRSDFGFKTYNPALDKGSQWFKEWNFKKMVINVGINYPF